LFVIDIFGFSRGAAQARALVNEIHRLSNSNSYYWGGTRIQVRYLGLFDTVGSVGMPGDDDDTNFLVNDDLSGEISLSIHPSAVQNAVHLTAYDERRDYFPVTSLKSESGGLASNFIEEVLPGVHSDIGGGYGPVVDKVYFQKNKISTVGRMLEDKIEIIKSELMAKTAAEFPYYQIDKIEVEQEYLGDNIYKYVFQPVSYREVGHELSHSALHIMYEYALKFGVPLEPLENLPNKPAKYEYKIPNKMRNLLDQIKQEGFDSIAHFHLNRWYIHHSNQYGAKPGDLLNPHLEDTDAEHTAENGQREQFFNQLSEAVEPEN